MVYFYSDDHGQGHEGDVWAYDGKPWQNGNNESHNRKFHDECLSMEWFRNRIDAKNRATPKRPFAYDGTLSIEP